jgi:hypothetical protein
VPVTPVESNVQASVQAKSSRHIATVKKTRIINKKKLNYKQLYFKKKYEVACFELKSKRQLHLDLKIRRKQLENLNKN